MKGRIYIRKLGCERFLEYIVSSDYVKNVYSNASNLRYPRRIMVFSPLDVSTVV